MTAALKPLSASRDTLMDRLGRKLADRLQSQTSGYEPYTPSDPETLARTLRPGDILLIEGNQKVSAAIKYLTQSTWSHAALFVGEAAPLTLDQAALPAASFDIVCAIEASARSRAAKATTGKLRPTIETGPCRTSAEE